MKKYFVLIVNLDPKPNFIDRMMKNKIPKMWWNLFYLMKSNWIRFMDEQF